MVFTPSARTRQCDIYINNCSILNASLTPISPIDYFLNEKQKLLIMTNPVPGQIGQPTFLGLIFLGIISSVENYYRRVISETLSIDPNSKTKAQDQMISFGSLNWYSPEEIGNAFVDDGSLASGKNIKEIISRLIGFDITSEKVIKYALNRFDLICQIRHCLIHANGHIRALNAKRLSIDKSCIGGRIDLTLPFLHETIAFSEHLVRETNIYLFDKIMVRMFKTGDEKFTQSYLNDKVLFKKLLDIYISKNDISINNKQYYSIYSNYLKTLCS